MLVRQDADVSHDVLSDAVSYVRPRLMRSNSAGDRLRTLWAAVKASRDLGAVDIVEVEFLNSPAMPDSHQRSGTRSVRRKNRPTRHPLGDARHEPISMRPCYKSEFHGGLRGRI